MLYSLLCGSCALAGLITTTQELVNMSHSPYEEDLVRLIQTLSPAKQRQLADITKALAEPIEADINWTAGLVTPEFADEFASRLQLHHATHSKELQRTAIEDAFRASSMAAGRTVSPPMSATARFIDEVIDGEGVALKGTAARDIKADRVHISKLCEAAWIQDVRGAASREEAAKNQIRMYLELVDRIYQLRVMPSALQWIYELVEIPVTLFEPILHLDRNLFAPDGPRIEVNDGLGLCMMLILDRSDSKITISKIPMTRCIVHGRWSLAKREMPIQSD
jgi:hypothetical protein